MNSVAALAVAAQSANNPAFIDASVSRILMRFVLPNKNAVYPHLWSLPYEQLRASRKDEERTPIPGIKFIEPNYNVGLRAFVFELADEDFVLADATCTEAPHHKRPEQTVLTAAFLFERAPQVAELRFKQALDSHAMPSLTNLCKASAWQTCVFRNPTPPGYMMSVNCAQPVLSAKHKPDKFLRILDGCITLE